VEAPVRVGELAFKLAIYTSDSTEFRPIEWGANHNQFESRAAMAGTGASQQRTNESHVVVRTYPAPEDRARFDVWCRLPAPVKAVKIALDLPALNMLAPEATEMPEGTWRQWDYPAFWRAGFAIWSDGKRFFTVTTQDVPWHFKRLRVLRRDAQMGLEIVQDASLRTRSLDFRTSVWEIGYRSEVDSLLDEHARFVSQAFGARHFDCRPDAPAWLRRVGLVVNLHGTDWTGRTHLDFAGMTAAAEHLAGRFPPDRTILYPIGWDGPYMRNYPDFQPSRELGGPEGFGRFCAAARAAGFHVMPHLNAMVCNPRNPLFAGHLEHYTLRNFLGNPVRCQHIDWDRDGLPDTAHNYISLIPRGLRDVLRATVDRLVRQYRVDAVFLDETCNVFYNDPAWDQVEGVRRLIRELRQDHPDLLIAGEEWNELILGLTPLVQVWEETADGQAAFGRRKSPLMRRWAARFIRACGYLGLVSPDGSRGVHEWPPAPWVAETENDGYYIPTLAITGSTLQRGQEGIRATVARAEDYVRRFAEA